MATRKVHYRKGRADEGNTPSHSEGMKLWNESKERPRKRLGKNVNKEKDKRKVKAKMNETKGRRKEGVETGEGEGQNPK